MNRVKVKKIGVFDAEPWPMNLVVHSFNCLVLLLFSAVVVFIPRCAVLNGFPL